MELAFVKVGKKWLNTANILEVGAATEGTMAVRLTDGTKRIANEEETTEFLGQASIDKEEFFADLPEPTPPAVPQDWLTPATDETVNAQFTRENPGQAITSHDAPDEAEDEAEKEEAEA